MASDDIGCSLAEAAETGLYSDYLSQAAATGKPAMHVVYINTSLKTKAEAHAVVPTITCTSSNVVQTVLQVSALASLCCLAPPLMTLYTLKNCSYITGMSIDQYLFCSCRVDLNCVCKVINVGMGT